MRTRPDRDEGTKEPFAYYAINILPNFHDNHYRTVATHLE